MQRGGHIWKRRVSRSATPTRVRGRRGAPTAVAALGVVIALSVAGCSQESSTLVTPDGSTISTTTTRIAQVNVVSPGRDYTKTCLAPTAAAHPAADPARIVVTDPALLDDLCALGLESKVTAVTSSPGSIPAYLGPQLTAVPAIGTSPDGPAVGAAHPDIVLTTPRTAAAAANFGSTKKVSIAATDWQARFTAVAAALDRSAQSSRLLAEFTAEATRTGTRMDAAHDQISLVRFTGDSEILAGTSTFAGQILTLIGVQRPAPQRGAASVAVTDATFNAADADLIYVSFVGDAGQNHGTSVLLSDRWLDMGAPTWKRVLNVDDEIWYRTSGLAAAWLVLNDVKGSLNGNS